MKVLNPCTSARSARRSAPSRRGDVQEPAHVGGGAAGAIRRVIDPRVRVAQVRGLHAPETRQPAVGLRARDPEHTGLVGAHPDGDGVGGSRAALGSVHGVISAAVQRRAVTGIPDAADQVDRLGQCVDGLARAQAPTAHGLDGIPECTGAQPQIEASVAQQVERRRGAGDHRRRPQRQIEHVRRELDLRRHRGHVREQRPRVVESGLIRMVLEGDQVVAELLAQQGEGDRSVRLGVRRSDERAEPQWMPVIHSSTVTQKTSRRCVMHRRDVRLPAACLSGGEA